MSEEAEGELMEEDGDEEGEQEMESEEGEEDKEELVSVESLQPVPKK